MPQGREQKGKPWARIISGHEQWMSGSQQQACMYQYHLKEGFRKTITTLKIRQYGLEIGKLSVF